MVQLLKFHINLNIQIDVYTNNYDTTQTLANNVRNRLDRFVGTVNGISVQTIKYMSSDSQVYNADYFVYHILSSLIIY